MHRTLLIILFTLTFMLGGQKLQQIPKAMASSGSSESSSTVINGSTNQSSKVLASEWLSKSSMPRLVNRPMDAREIAYILRKVGFDPSPSEVSEWIGKERKQLVAELLAGLKTAPVIEPPRWTFSEPRYWGHVDWSRNKKNAFRTARRQEIGQLRQWWIKQMLVSDSPFGERLVLFWENTFVAGFSGLKNKSHAQWIHHKTIRRRATGDYRELVLSMVKDPAILIYLDNNRNKNGSPNENLARELLELFTLGESNYSEKDIKESARALAGWHVSKFGKIRFQERGWARDYGEKTIFNRTGAFNGDDLVDLILSHPSSAEFLVRRLWVEFVSLDPIPDQALNHWVNAFRETGYQIKELLTVMLNSTYFWDEQYRGTSVKSPVELLVGALRASQNNAVPLPALVSGLSEMGQTLFEPPDVSGWGYGEYWLNSGKLIERERFQDLVASNLMASAKTLIEMDMKGSSSQQLVSHSPTKSSSSKKLRLKLAGEAYKGLPSYKISIKHSQGVWFSDVYFLGSARDTERLGRYKNESQWVWETVSIKVPREIEDAEAVSVHFLNNAAGNGGDRNLFIGALEWEGNAFAGSLGKQISACRGKKKKKVRRPERLYCNGTLILNWKTLVLLKKNTMDFGKSDGNFVTNELVLLSLKQPRKGGYQNLDMMFDGLKFKNRSWDYYGFRLVRDARQGRDRYHLSIREDRCSPKCFVKWPSEARTDKSGLRYIDIYFKNEKSSANDQYFGLSGADKEFVKAIISLMPQIKIMVEGTKAHREATSKDVWLKRMDQFVDYSKALRWQPDMPVDLTELNSRGGDTRQIMMAMGMVSNSTLRQGSYQLFPKAIPTQKHWHELLESKLVLASEPLESWMLSFYEGERLTDLDKVIASPYFNIK